MKTRAFLTILLVTILALASSGMAQEQCSAETVKGTYALSCNGWINLGPNAAGPFAPVDVQGRFLNVILPDGTLASKSIGKVVMSLAGTLVTPTYVSTEITVKPNCTGTITYHVTYPFPLSKEEDLSNSILILDEGKELRIIDTTVGIGHVATCNARLMSRNTNQDQTE